MVANATDQNFKINFVWQLCIRELYEMFSYDRDHVYLHGENLSRSTESVSALVKSFARAIEVVELCKFQLRV